MASGISPWNNPWDSLLHAIGQVTLQNIHYFHLFALDYYSYLEKILRLPRPTRPS